MELLELRYFIEVAAAGSFSKAAVKLSLSQPTLSRQLNKLEGEMRTELFYRHGRGVSLTEAGKRLLDVATGTVQRLEDVKSELRSHELDKIGEVIIGMPPSIAATVGADLAIAFSAAYPNAHLRMRESFSGILLEWIEGRRLDLAVLYDARRGSNILATPLLLEELFLIEAPREGEIEAAELGELRERPCLLTGPGNGLRRVVDAACWSEHIQPQVLIEVDCVAALKQLVERGVGCTVLPFGAVHREVHEGRLIARPFNTPTMRAMLVIATPPHKPVSPLIRSVIRMLQKEVQRLGTSGVLKGETRHLGALGRRSIPDTQTKALQDA
jgi:LysR family transcriptional regulator, nitrogen assimilation regulatory protein